MNVSYCGGRGHRPGLDRGPVASRDFSTDAAPLSDHYSWPRRWWPAIAGWGVFPFAVPSRAHVRRLRFAAFSRPPRAVVRQPVSGPGRHASGLAPDRLRRAAATFGRGRGRYRTAVATLRSVLRPAPPDRDFSGGSWCRSWPCCGRACAPKPPCCRSLSGFSATGTAIPGSTPPGCRCSGSWSRPWPWSAWPCSRYRCSPPPASGSCSRPPGAARRSCTAWPGSKATGCSSPRPCCARPGLSCSAATACSPAWPWCWPVAPSPWPPCSRVWPCSSVRACGAIWPTAARRSASPCSTWARASPWP